jgi:O-antigen ligase
MQIQIKHKCRCGRLTIARAIGMTGQRFKIAFKIFGVATFQGLLLFGFGIARPSDDAGLFNQFVVLVRDPDTQWLVFTCLVAYFAAFSAMRFGVTEWPASHTLFLDAVLAVSVLAYFSRNSPSEGALTLLGGAVIGHGVGVLKGKKLMADRAGAVGLSRESNMDDTNELEWGRLLITILALFLAIASVLRPEPATYFQYHSQSRSSGPWRNPDIFGLLMGTGVVLVLGHLVSSFNFRVLTPLVKGRWSFNNCRLWRGIVSFMNIFAAVLMGLALFRSYCRGAWVAVGCGLSYLLYQDVKRYRIPRRLAAFRVDSFNEALTQMARSKNRFSDFSCILWLTKNVRPLMVVALSVVGITFWQSQYTDWLPARRMFSAANVNDFSWGNRIFAWEGALQITAEHPWFGVGWGRTEPLYDNYYIPSNLSNGAAIEMNDYLMLGATLGIFACFFFGMYLWLSLVQKPRRKMKNLEDTQLDCFKTTCRAGAIVLLVGFWFDGGLFKLPTAATFWILQELGQEDL